MNSAPLLESRTLSEMATPTAPSSRTALTWPSLGRVSEYDDQRFIALCAPQSVRDAGLSHGQFLAATRQGAPGFVLLRASHIHRTPGMPGGSAASLHEIRVEAEVLGAIESDDGGVYRYSAGLPLSAWAGEWSLHAVPPTALRAVANLASASPQGSFSLGQLRWAERWDPQASVPVRLPVSDIVGKRSAMFGKTRLGKSNVVKLIMQGVLDASAESRNVGQLVFDVNGEYANDNPQDGNFSIASAYRDRVLAYFLATHSRGAEGRFLRYDFFRISEEVIRIFEELLPQDILDAPGLRDILVVRLPSLQEVHEGQKAESIKAQPLRRRLFLYWTLLAKAGFAPDDEALARAIGPSVNGTPAFNPAFSQALRLTAWQAIRGTPPPKAVASFSEMCEEMEVVSEFSLRYENDPSLRTGRVELFDDEDRALQMLLCERNGAGPFMLRSCLPYHSPEADHFIQNILLALDEGRTVILDMGAAAERIVRYFSRIICEAVFHHQEARFITGSLGNRFVQIFFEEAHMIFPANEQQRGIDIYARFAKEGAKFHIGIVYATQSPSSVSPSLLTQTENFFIGHLSSPNELEILAGVQSQFRSQVRGVLESRVPGYLRVLTFSNRYVLPVQADRFDPRKNQR